MKFYTIGYGDRAPDDFASLLARHGMRLIADVRIHPERASMGSYVKARTADKWIEKLSPSSRYRRMWDQLTKLSGLRRIQTGQRAPNKADRK